MGLAKDDTVENVRVFLIYAKLVVMTSTTNASTITSDDNKKFEKRLNIIFGCFLAALFVPLIVLGIIAATHPAHVTTLEQSIGQDARINHIEITKTSSRYAGNGFNVNVELNEDYSSQQNQHEIGVEVLKKIYNSKEWIANKTQYIIYGSWTMKAPHSIYDFGGTVHSYDLQEVFSKPTEK